MLECNVMIQSARVTGFFIGQHIKTFYCSCRYRGQERVSCRVQGQVLHKGQGLVMGIAQGSVMCIAQAAGTGKA